MEITAVAVATRCSRFPFVLSGVVVTIALTRTSGSVGRLYAADLSGAAFGLSGRDRAAELVRHHFGGVRGRRRCGDGRVGLPPVRGRPGRRDGAGTWCWRPVRSDRGDERHARRRLRDHLSQESIAMAGAAECGNVRVELALLHHRAEATGRARRFCGARASARIVSPRPLRGWRSTARPARRSRVGRKTREHRLGAVRRHGASCTTCAAAARRSSVWAAGATSCRRCGAGAPSPASR